MNPLLLTGIFDALGKVFDRAFPDPEKKAQAQLELLRMNQAGEFKELDANLQLALAQIGTNQVEAASPSLFKSGWRPFIGWVCGFGLAYQFLLRPLLTFAVALAGHAVVPPELDMETLLALLSGLLGLGSLRTLEKLKGKA